MRVLSIIFTIVFIHKAGAQDPFFTQYKTSGMFMNPAFAGITNDLRTSMQARAQWPMAPNGGYKTAMISMDGKVPLIKGGVGYYYLFDLASDVFYSHVHSFSYSPKIVLRNRVMLSPGIKFSYSTDGFVRKKLVSLKDSTLNEEISSWGKAKNMNVSLGFVVNTKYYHWGLAIDHLVRNQRLIDGSIAKETPILTVHADYIYQLRKKIFFIPSGFYRYDFLRGAFWNINGSLKYKSVMFGLGTRHWSQWLFFCGIQMQKLSVSYSYDYYMSAPTYQSLTKGGAHELALVYYLN